MTFDLALLSAVAAAYLLLLFLIAWASDRGWIPARLTAHPVTHVLSLGVFATSWSYYGSVGFAAEEGIHFLAIYLGVTLAFVLTPVLLTPILRLTRTHQLTSVADLFALRFRSQSAGVLVTLLMLAGVLPYIALQIRAVAESTRLLTPAASADLPALGFVGLVILFTALFGARHVSPRQRHDGLVTAIAFESLLKLLALLRVAGFATWQAFGGPGGLQAWLSANPEQLEALYAPGHEGRWTSLLVIAFAAGFLLPRQFHMLFVENHSERNLRVASWGFPLFLLVLTAAIPPILWAAVVLRPETPADYHVLGLAMLTERPALAVLAYLGGLSAASAMIVVSTLAVAAMVLNHLILPLAGGGPRKDVYGALRWARRCVIVAVITAGYGFYRILDPGDGLVGWGLVSFLAMAQLLPGIAGLLFWPRATRAGFLAGLSTGIALWAGGVLLPPVAGVDPLGALGLVLPGSSGTGVDESTVFWTLFLNALVFATVSLATRPDEQERQAAAACTGAGTALPEALPGESPRRLARRLTPFMGGDAAAQEIDRGLRALDLEASEDRPTALRALRVQVERNLSALVGPVLARVMVEGGGQRSEAGSTRADVLLFEDQLESSAPPLRGIAAELDRLRRYHRQIIEDLPIGVCAVTPDGRLMRWNSALAALTRVPVDSALGARVDDLAPPWGPLLAEFLADPARHWHRQGLRLDGESRWYSLHKAVVETPPGAKATGAEDTLVLVEDLTGVSRLEQELAHSERLASIGRLAAGVAHEIGNPVTAISCLAQELRDEPVETARTREVARDLLHQSERINGIVQSLVRHAHGGGDSGEAPETVALPEAVDEAIRLATLGRRDAAGRVTQSLPEGLATPGHRQRLVQVFVNLLTNALDAGGDPGAAPATVGITGCAVSGGRVRVDVTDNGPGIPEAISGQVLEPFVTTKQPGQGTGLGLHLAYTTIRDHGGELAVASDPSGTRITLWLPQAEPDSFAAPPGAHYHGPDPADRG